MTSSTKTISAIPTRGDRLPLFTGQTPEGAPLRLRDFYMRRNLALVFSDGPEYTTTRDLLRGLAERRAAVQAEAGEALAVISGDPERVCRFVAELSLPFPIVVDPDNAIH
ncbi:MAG TPA: redoxin domain-containing protein, partial [Nitrolancea sp.]